MELPLSHRPHGKKSPGLTNTIRHTLLKVQKEQPQNQIVNHLMGKFNSPSTQNSKKNYGKAYQANLIMHTSKNSQQYTLQAFQGVNQRGPLQHLPQKQVHLSAAKLQRVLSADRTALKTKLSHKFKHPKKAKAGLLINPPQHLSKRSTEYSSQSQEQALKLQNQKIKELCLTQHQNLLRLQKLIANENKVQLLQRQMYQQNIQRLEKIAALQIFPSEGSDYPPQSLPESCQEYDCLSIESN